MIKPPFTVVILKDSFQPMAIRVTKKFVLFLFLIMSSLFGLAIYGIIFYLPHNNINLASPDAGKKLKEPEYILLENKNNTVTKTDVLSEPDVKDLSIKHLDDGKLEIMFDFANITDNNDFYVWLLLNSDVETSGETIIYPRSPIFRGLPVDYRNGILYNISSDKYLKATFPELIVGNDFNQIRIIAYSLEGDIIINKSFNIQQNIRK